MFKCAYDDCNSKNITATSYRCSYKDDILVCLTYECVCRDCGGRFAHSKNLEA